MKLITIKATPHMILGLLKCINENEGNIPNMKNCIHLYLQKLSGKEKQRNIRSDVYGVALPSLRKLKLIRGHGRLLRLNSNGKLLLRSHSAGGIDKFKHQFGRLLLDIDERNCKIVSSLVDISSIKRSDSVSHGRLVKALVEKGIETREKDERLRKWLPFLKFVSLIREVKENTLQVNFELLESYKMERTIVSSEAFEEIVFEEYQKLEIKEGVYVPICMLSERTCARLIERGDSFTTFDFERYFIALLNKYSSLEKKKILLSQPGKREEEGMYIDNTYYYFVSIYDVRESKA